MSRGRRTSLLSGVVHPVEVLTVHEDTHHRSCERRSASFTSPYPARRANSDCRGSPTRRCRVFLPRRLCGRSSPPAALGSSASSSLAKGSRPPSDEILLPWISSFRRRSVRRERPKGGQIEPQRFRFRFTHRGRHRRAPVSPPKAGEIVICLGTPGVDVSKTRIAATPVPGNSCRAPVHGPVDDGAVKASLPDRNKPSPSPAPPPNAEYGTIPGDTGQSSRKFGCDRALATARGHKIDGPYQGPGHCARQDACRDGALE